MDAILLPNIADVCQASVVFGVGKDYYKTETVESSTPEWNQEARMWVELEAELLAKAFQSHFSPPQIEVKEGGAVVFLYFPHTVEPL